jgi:hypothetical protein
MADIGWPATRGLNKPPDYKKRCRGPGTSRLWRFCENKVCAERDKSQIAGLSALKRTNIGTSEAFEWHDIGRSRVIARLHERR